MTQSYVDLNIWARSIELAEGIYKITKNFPKEEIYGLTSQMRRCAVSIPSNIAEGSTRGNKEFRRFLNISSGSLAELKTQIIIAYKINILSNELQQPLLQEIETIGKMVNGLKRSIEGVKNFENC